MEKTESSPLHTLPVGKVCIFCISGYPEFQPEKLNDLLNKQCFAEKQKIGS